MSSRFKPLLAGISDGGKKNDTNVFLKEERKEISTNNYFGEIHNSILEMLILR